MISKIFCCSSAADTKEEAEALEAELSSFEASVLPHARLCAFENLMMQSRNERPNLATFASLNSQTAK
jgi:hypothetical protein